MFVIYDLIFLIFFLFCLPIYLFKGKFHQGFLMRFGKFVPPENLDHPIWIHAVSVGEALSIKNIIKELKLLYPGKKFVISTVTPTGNKIARSIAASDDFVIYLPLDFSFSVRSSLNKIKPSLFIIVETEIWPNLITCLHKKNVPVLVINGRISDDSFKGYSLIKFFLKPILDKVSMFCVQTQNDAERLMKLGAARERVQVTGNMKFDNAAILKIDSADYRKKIALNTEEKLFVAASTHPGEEEIIIRAYKNLILDFKNLRLLIAPRHPQRAQEVALIIERLGLNGPKIHILDTVGELLGFYSLADVVFVGGSLVKKGGHNILEPISLLKPVMFGPYMHNFRSIADLFLKNNSAISVYNQKEIELAVKDLLNNPRKGISLAEAGKNLILQNQGATRRNLELIKKYI